MSAIKRFCELNGVIEGLYLVDLLCRGIPSPKANQLYLEQIAKERGSRVVAQYHKDKTYGWRSLATKYELENGTSFVERIEDSDWGKSFICYDYCTRESCFSCSYKKEERVSDITLGDFWGVNDPELDDNRGTSAVFVNTQKGSWLFSNIIQDIIYKSFTFQDVANEKNKGAFSPLRDNKLERILFWELLKTNDYRTTVKLVREREVLEDDLQRKAKEFEFQSIRNKKKFDIVCKWMQLKQHNISIMSYLKERNMMSVAIYGAGELGILLYKELSCESDYVKYILDKNAQEMPLQDKSVPVYSVEDMKVTPVDLVIVTPVFVIDEVKGLILERFPKQKVLELEEVLSEMSNIL